MMRSWFATIALSASVGALATPPATVELAYAVERDGSSIATVAVAITHDATRYRIEERWSGSGLFALSGDMTRVSLGRVAAPSLQPQEYIHQRRGEVERVLFDRSAGRATREAKGEKHQESISGPTGDRLTELYGLAFVDSMPERLSLRIIDGRGAALHEYRRAGFERLAFPTGAVDALRLDRVYPHGEKRSVRIWVSRAHGGLPVLVQTVDAKGRRIEQRLTRYTAP